MIKMLDYESVIGDVLDFGKRYYDDVWFRHACKVRDLALKIFDETRELDLHDMGDRERFWLEVSALLHDIGRKVDEDDHHIYSRRLILQFRQLEKRIGFTELNIIAWIAFFHRNKPDPRKYEDSEWQKILHSDKGLTLLKLISILRIADALDRTLSQLVEDIKLQFADDSKVFKLKTSRNAPIEIERAYKKSKLFKQVFKKDITITELSK